MANEEGPFIIHMKDDTVVTNVCVGKDAGFDVNGVRINDPKLPTPISKTVAGVPEVLLPGPEAQT